MPKFDPKLLKRIPQSQLIAAAKEIGIKNSDRVSKEILVNTFLEQVEAADEDSLSQPVIAMYNTIADIFDMVTSEEEPAEAEEPSEVEEEEEAEAKTETQPEEAEVSEEEVESVVETEAEVEEEFVETPPEEEVEEPKPVKKEVSKPMAQPSIPKKPAAAPATAAAPAVATVPKKPALAKPPVKPATAAAPAKKPVAPKRTSKNRFLCAGEAIRAKKMAGMVPAFIQLSDDIHVKSGGKSNLKEAATVGRAALNLLEGLGLIKVEGEKISPIQCA